MTPSTFDLLRPRDERALPAGAVLALAASAVVCVTVVLGWALQITWLQLSVHGQAMVPNTAVALLVLDVVLVGWGLHPRSAAARAALVVAGVAVAVLAAVSLSEDLAGWSASIDRVLLPGAITGQDAGRPAPQTAALLLLAGSTVAALGLGRVSRAAGDLAGMAMATVGVISLFGHVTEAEALTSLAGHTPIAVTTSLLLAVLGAVLLLSAGPGRGAGRLLDDTAEGLLLRRLIPIAVGWPMALALIRLLAVQGHIVDARSGDSLLVIAISASMIWGSLNLARRVQRLDEERRRLAGQAAAVASSLAGAVLLLDADARCTSAMGQLEVLGPSTSEDIVGRSARTLIPDTAGEFDEAFAAARTGVARGFEVVDATNGSPRSRVVSLSPLADSEGQAVVMLVTATTELWSSRRDAHDTEAAYRELVDHSLQGMFRTTIDGHVTLANPALLRMLGYASHEEFRATVPDGRAVWVDPTARLAVLERLGHQPTVPVEATWRTSDGSVIEVRGEAVATRDDDGNLKGFEGLVLDVTSERRLAAAQERWQVAAEHSATGLALLSLDQPGRFTEVNQRMAEILGFDSTAELSKIDPRSLVPPDRVAAEFAVVGALSAGTEVSGQLESTRLRRDGSVVDVELTLSVIRAPDSEPLLLTALDDISKRKRLETITRDATARTARQAKAQAALAAISRLALRDERLERVLDRAASATATVLDASASMVLEVAGPAFTVRATHGQLIEPEGVVQAPLASLVIADNDVVVVEDWKAETRFARSPLSTAIDARCSVALPIDGSHGAFGVIELADTQPRTFNEDELQFLRGVAHALGLAVRHHDVVHDLTRSQRTLQAMLDNAPSVIYLTDRDGRIVLANKAMATLADVNASEILGRRRADLAALAGIPVAAAPESTERLLSLGQPRTSTEHSFDRDGTKRSFLAVQFPLLDERGELYAIGDIWTDVTALENARVEVQHAWHEAIHRLSQAVEYRDEETGAHTARMAAYCHAIARELGLPPARCEELRDAAPMHDAGKVAIPDAVLLKPGPLTPEERAVMQRHAEIGYMLMSGSGAPLLDTAAQIAWTHHERWDGTGYPRYLVGDAIPLSGRIAAAADVYDALTNARPYRAALPVDDALKIMRGGRGHHFDPAVLDAFLRAHDEIETLRGAFGETVQGARYHGLEPVVTGSPAT